MRRGRVLLAASLVAGAVWLACSADAARGAVRQEAARDTAVGDTIPSDTAGVVGDTAAAAGDTTRKIQSLPALPPSDPGFSVRRFECDRGCLLDHNALVLMDLLENEMPGLTMLRGSYFTGPHHLLSGIAGAGFTEVRLDGRPVAPLAAGQMELARIPVASLDGVTVSETPAGLVVDAATTRRSEPRAYSRISAATGSPDVNRIHALFSNGLGEDFEVTTGIDLLNTEAEGAGGDRFDFWGSVAWIPGDDRAGVEIQWRNQTLDRTGLDTASVDRREILVTGRGRLQEDIWITLAAGNTRREVSGGGSSGSLAVEDPLVTEVDQASVEVELREERHRVSAGLDVRDGPGQPSLGARLRAGIVPLTDVRVTAGAETTRWEGFDGWNAEAGAVFRPDVGVDLELGVGGATGVRGVPRPLEDRADSLTYTRAQGQVSAGIGPVSATIRGFYEDLSRRLPFGGTMDAALRPGPGVTVGAVEGTLEAPLIPMAWLLGEGARPVRLVGTWRRQEIVDSASVSLDTTGAPAVPADLYLPIDQARIAALLEDTYFQGDLRIRAELAVRHRSGMRSFDPTGGSVGQVAGWTTADWNLMLKIKDVRIWWRVDNTRSAPWEDLVGVVRPIRRNMFGVRWEFYN